MLVSGLSGRSRRILLGVISRFFAYGLGGEKCFTDYVPIVLTPVNQGYHAAALHHHRLEFRSTALAQVQSISGF